MIFFMLVVYFCVKNGVACRCFPSRAVTVADQSIAPWRDPGEPLLDGNASAADAGPLTGRDVLIARHRELEGRRGVAAPSTARRGGMR